MPVQSGDNDPNRRREAARPDPDAHGQAALLLVESLLHGLLEKGVLSNGEAIAIVTAAAEVKEEIAATASEAQDTARQSLDLIGRIVATLELDDDGDPQDRPIAGLADE
ncbi:hypothetical protein [Sphingomonas sp. CROZ-RG-20F-R02-07]|uniref:hypothetical protein n=1 Tax=Sphingomonas sp. CROZ-RG-20F-R02-07 TaxID=2914832 RepID=UPI001F55DF0D|nr:hypothetical protein [Sphingomonas sp. CROZ-RG-20F-R02-07]